MKITTRKRLDSADLDDLVRATYGRPYTFQQQDGCRSRGIEHVSVPSDGYDFDATEIPEKINGEKMGVSFAAWLARDPEAPVGTRGDGWALGMFWDRNFYPHIDMILNDLHARGLIEAGEYVIVIDW